ncbi:TlpA family protein disulfide reductase [Effusibacillus dendaii]|uniref:Thiol:disulfide interchange protein n=1 Tax=Effusibacillus dendaii TaxID=2743772 RepID=A0A7I8DG94_9BACL|nr:TlpA disulfide reductase family protein [Effusibacillus dendaii]BCJ88352.1 thiol:disulfide interchange protein [Effusibacillus dendaii]
MERKKWGRLSIGILFAAVLILIVGAGWQNSSKTKGGVSSSADSKSGKSQQEVAAMPRPGYRAPDFTLHDLNGTAVKLSDLKGKKVLINFWASWCPPCKAETPDLVEMSQKYKDKVAFYGVNLTVTDDEESVRRFVSQYQIQYPILLDQDGRVGTQYQTNAIPMTVTIDQNGMIVDRRDGQLSRAAMEGMIQKLVER